MIVVSVGGLTAIEFDKFDSDRSVSKTNLKTAAGVGAP